MINSSLNEEIPQRAEVEFIYSQVFESRPHAVEVSFTTDHRVQRKRGRISTSIHFLERKSDVSLSPPILPWLFTHHSCRQDLVPRSPAGVDLRPTVTTEISPRIHLQITRNSGCGFSAANNPVYESALKLYMRVYNKRMPANAATQS